MECRIYIREIQRVLRRQKKVENFALFYPKIIDEYVKNWLLGSVSHEFYTIFIPDTELERQVYQDKVFYKGKTNKYAVFNKGDHWQVLLQ